MPKCTAVKANGEKCLQSAIPGTEPPKCFFHCYDYDSEKPRQRPPILPLTNDEAALILAREVRRLSKRKGGVEVTKAVLACLDRLDQLKAPKPITQPSDVKDLTAEERLALRGK